MTQKNRAQRRREAAQYWDSHDVTEGAANDDDVGEPIEVRKPLSAMLTLRLHDDDLAKLKLVAKTQGVGLTTMARILLHRSLEDPKNQAASLQPLSEVRLREIVRDELQDALRHPAPDSPA